MKKRIHGAIRYPEGEEHCRFAIFSAMRILNRFQTEKGFETYCERDDITIRVGLADFASFGFFPETWEAIETALETMVCFYIQSGELNKYPYYKKLFNEFSKELGRTDFVN